jgi:hypothetical protein
MYELRNPVGRLLTLRLAAPISDAEAELLSAQARQEMGAHARRIVTCVDLSESHTLSASVSDRLTQLMRGDNPRIERSGFLINRESATLGLQVERMLREANNPSRRTFHAASDLIQWLDEVLSSQELAALREFLSKHRRD